MRIHVLILAASLALTAGAVEQWGLFEASFTGPASGNPYLDVPLSATFTRGAQRITVPGFWDGGGTYKVRFMPPAPGEWRYETSSSAPELNGQAGAFTATPPAAGNHGPVRPFNTFYLRYEDGTPYHQFGTTCYAWVHQTRALQEQTLQTLAASPFNKIRFCVFPKSYAYNKNEPEFFAFQKGADGKFDFSRPDPAFWRHFEQRILDLQKLGIEADLILWHPYDRWGFKKMTGEQDDRYLRYCIARLSACRNVWWSLANEYDFMSDLDDRHQGIKTMDDWDRFFAILQKEDPYGRMRGIHNGAIWYDHTQPWVIHASLQTSDMNGGVRFREKYQKPVIYDECKYEGNIPQGWGSLTAREMTQRFWLGTLSGCYVGHGETYKHPEDLLWWAKGGVLHGESPKRIQWLKEFMAQAPPFHELKPLGDDKGRFVLAKAGEYYLVYCVNTRSQTTLELAGTRPYKVDMIDPWAMTLSPVGTARPGAFTVNSPTAHMVFRLMPYAAGEPLRPEARIQATPAEGLPPLAVAFKAVTDAAQAEWDFGDGGKATGPEAKHTFTQPGVHTVTLKVTGQNGATAIACAEIVTDGDVTKPLVRAGFAGDEQPSLKFHGTAKRGAEGALLLPAGAPWGWVQAGDIPIEDLRGLRSFTISAWVRPGSLETGAGGNRILFCLNKDTDGIDLVCHADGRLRLSVNEWPDGIKNDSSPGKLVVGKWTFFAVTYDATRSQENVCWYFSPPLEAPGAADVKLDRATSYNRGPVGVDLRALAIGNFNRTMQSHGLDRQFRGEIRALQVFGSRVAGRGALSLETIRQHQP